MSILNAFTVDVEDYFQVSAFENDIDRRIWDRFPTRVERNTYRLLEFLADNDIQATFFVLGWIAERNPDLVKAIHDAGHEIASHSYWHRMLYTITPDEFREDVRRSKHVLEDTIGERVNIFRSPSFSITRETTWALDILIEEGFEIDSSVFPIYHDRYGIPDARRDIHRIETSNGSIWEFPPSVIEYGNFNLPVSGGGYFRFYPIALTNYWLRQINVQKKRPFIFYVHPWEIDPEQPRLRAGSVASRIRHRMNLSTTEAKLQKLVDKFEFGNVSQVVEQAFSTVSSHVHQIAGVHP
jgi:polysaccharide deacetylase family protein (PEP-CTERM system associated)